jgi:hypothetical protein
MWYYRRLPDGLVIMQSRRDLEAILTDRKAAIVERHAEVADNLSD